MEKDSSTTAAAMLALSLTRLPTPAPTRVSSRAVVGAIESAVVKEQIRQQLPSGTSSDDTSDEQPTPKAAAALRQRNDAGEKKRKPTYYMRKDEMAQLQEEIATLQATIRQLETKSMCVTQTLGTALDWNTNLRSRVRHGDLTVARAQSLLSSFGIQHRTPPLGGFIHLPRNVVDRQRTLSALKMPRIQEALAYTLARSQFLDVTKTTCQFDTFETDTGDFVTTHWEITPLHDARSVRHAFEEVLYFYETHEMTLSEKLGVLSIRESESEMVDGAQAVRLLSKHDNGAQVEANLALFSQYFEKSEMLDQPHAVMAVDYVDQDDLYSFQPQSRIHKDVVSSVIIMEAPASRGSSTSGPPVVTMIRLAFVRVNSSTYTSRSVLEQVARDGGGKWCDVMLKLAIVEEASLQGEMAEAMGSRSEPVDPSDHWLRPSLLIFLFGIRMRINEDGLLLKLAIERSAKDRQMDGHDPDAGTSSASESSVEAPRLSKRKAHGDTSAPLPSKRKTTYYLRKDEIESLQDQIKSLQEKLQKCEREARLGKLTLPNVEATNEFLANCVEQNSLSVAGTQSMMTAYNLAMVQSDGVVPLQSYVHLPADADQRAEILSGLFQSKLRSAVRFMGERTRFLDLRVRHHQTEQFELPTGEVAVVALDVAQFEGGHSLRQVYDAFMFFLVNQEISVSEKLGVLTVRESDELDEIKYCQTRFLSSVRGGLEVESNTVMFAACVDATAESPGYAVGMLDFVDQDDLYPYRPDLCVRKDVTGAVTFNEIPSLTGGKPMIAMARWSHVRMPPPTFPLSPEAVTEVRTGMLQWCNIVSDIMKERLATIPPAP